MIKDLEEYNYDELWGISQDILDQFDEDELVEILNEKFKKEKIN